MAFSPRLIPHEMDLPVLPLRDTVLFPHSVLPLTIGRVSSVKLLESLEDDHNLVVAVAQRTATDDEPTLEDLYHTGTAALVLKVAKLPREQDTHVVLVEGRQRVRILWDVQREPFMTARVVPLDELAPDQEDAEFLALKRNIQEIFQEIVESSNTLSGELVPVVRSVEEGSRLADFVCSTLPTLDLEARQELLETLDVRARMRRLTEELVKQRENQRVQNKIQTDVEEKLANSQREMFLREQLRAIKKELGEGEEGLGDTEELKRQVEEAQMPEEVAKIAAREVSRLDQIPPAAAEYTVARSYLDWLIALPWAKHSETPVDVRKAEHILDEDHYGLKRVKERILEYLAVYQLKQNLKGPILCFVGPPGVGKTSLGRSIARALGRKFVRISLGGMHDEAEIRGHRRTYVGALPGQIIQGMRRAETNNPVFMLDEIDKLGRDFRGDPASALLEVLDPEQNNTFRDHYLDVPFDLSKTLFITTANQLEPIPEPLLDRMEVLELSGYTEEEKVEIAKRYLVPRQLEAHGLVGDGIRFTGDGLREVIASYTHEAGVRNLEREIGSLCRKHAKRVATGEGDRMTVDPETVRALLGLPRYHFETEVEERTRRPGVAVGLAWTPRGGDILFVEAARMPRDKGEFTITGSVKEVMQESMKAALTWVRANGSRYGLDASRFKECDIHIHVPSGAVPKDGPSAGVVLVAALISLFTERPVKSHLAMTGEITLSGLVLPVGGIREKVLAARRSGITHLVLPEKNEANLVEDVPAHLLEGITVHFVKTIDEALRLAFG